MGKMSPDIQKIVAAPGFIDHIAKALDGKDVGDFVKNAPQDAGAMPGYVANAMGLGTAGETAIKQATEEGQKIAEKKGLYNAPSSYVASSGGKAAAEGPAPDFAKMMEDMMKALNPDMAAGEKKAPAAAAEQVFRQMELLPTEKLLQNRDISICARIGFRYRKSLEKVDQLNWAVQENSGAGSVVTGNTASGDRAPAQNR